jgi:hypothetical protein
MPSETENRLRRWLGYGVVELDKELQHLRRAAPSCSAIPDLERYLGERRAQAERTYGGVRIEAR